MASGVEVISSSAAKNQEEAVRVLGRLFDVAKPNVIYGEPVTSGEYTVITAGEVSVGMGLGFGGGGGEAQEPEKENASGAGMGGGGGGASAGRPVAAIVIGPHGVRVEPIFDVTKVAIAFFTALGAMFMARRAMRKKLR
jgi:uncharacterized spore protein YtfJ